MTRIERAGRTQRSPRLPGLGWLLRSGERGQSIVEVALIVPVALLLLAGALDMGRLFHARVSIENAAREGAVFGAVNPRCDTAARSDCADPQTADWRVRNEVRNLSGLTTTFTCLDGAIARDSVAACEAGDTYAVTVQDRFDFVTPILAPIFGTTMTLDASASAVVLNDALDPTAAFAEWPESPMQPSQSPSPSSSPAGATCTVPDLVGQKADSADITWHGAGFTGSYIDGGGSGNYSIGWQSLAPGSIEACTSSVTVMKDAP